jgi:hypothetical protein
VGGEGCRISRVVPSWPGLAGLARPSFRTTIRTVDESIDWPAGVTSGISAVVRSHESGWDRGCGIKKALTPRTP